MTEPSNNADTSGSSDDTRARLAALRRSSGRPAEAARILTTGLAGSMVLGMTAAMGWSDTRATNQSIAALEAPPTTTDTAPIVAPTGIDPVDTTATPLIPAAPVEAAPVAGPVLEQVVEVPIAVPVANGAAGTTADPSLIATAPQAVAQTRQSD